MLDTSALTTTVDRLADTLRRMPQSRLERGPAAEGLALAQELARRAQLLEFPAQEPLAMPDAGVFAVGDQLTVAGTDLAEALAPLDDEAGLDAALRLVAEAGPRVTGTR